jgi:hypothetical protein
MIPWVRLLDGIHIGESPMKSHQILKIVSGAVAALAAIVLAGMINTPSRVQAQNNGDSDEGSLIRIEFRNVSFDFGDDLGPVYLFAENIVTHGTCLFLGSQSLDPGIPDSCPLYILGTRKREF